MNYCRGTNLHSSGEYERLLTGYKSKNRNWRETTTAQWLRFNLREYQKLICMSIIEYWGILTTAQRLVIYIENDSCSNARFVI